MAKGIVKKALKIGGIGAVVIILLLLAIRLAVPVVGVRTANSQLSDIPGIRAKVKLDSLLHFPIRIEEVLLEDARIQVVRNKEQELDLDAVISAVTSSSDGAEEDAEAEPQEQEEPLNYPIVLEEVALRNLSVSYKDYSHEGGPYEAKLEHLTFVVSNLSLEAPRGKKTCLQKRRAQRIRYAVGTGHLSCTGTSASINLRASAKIRSS